MYCEELHSEFIKDDHLECPFCNKKLEETKSTGPKCCDRPDLINDSQIFCTYYGTVNDLRKKSIYHRKYHILNIIDDITRNNKIQISYNDREKILRIFALIDQVSQQVDHYRKRMVSIKLIYFEAAT